MKDVKLFRTQSVLRELIPEALASLDDTALQGLCVIEVRCKRGKYDADVYLDKMYFDANEQREILKKLRKVSRHLEHHCASAEGWYRCPHFHFKFDEQLEKQNHMEALFAQMEDELSKSKNR
ncbi:MAG: 30S ribosome-binding factor RbfA [Campylobacteraceae bacterium]|nr:30S ribosome-binding factor RbfA [Campylobacteraceae bacterium]